MTAHRPALFFCRIPALALFFLILASARVHGAPGPAAPAIVPPAAQVSEERVIIRRRVGKDLSEIHRRLGTRSRRLLRRGRNAPTADLEVVEVPRGQRAQVLDALRQSGLVDYAEPDYVLQAQGTEPNDPQFSGGTQWNLKNTGVYGGTAGADIDAPSAWDLRTSAASVVVAVIDTGIRSTHEDLRGNLWKNPGETGLDSQGRDKATNHVDDDGDGYVDDVYGINCLTHSGDPLDDYGHGSHVAGIIGATGNNALGITGVAWRVQLMAVKALDSSGNGTISTVIEGMDYARAHGARIINASWGSYGFTSQALRDAVTALRDNGIIFVAACGNSGGDNDSNPLYPASYDYDNIIAVAASTRTDTLASFSNWGRTSVDLAAPGSPVFSAWNGSDTDYRYLDGTSQAAPHVVGAAALIWAQNPTLTYRQVISYILNNTDPLPAFAGKTVTGGRLNLAQALAAVVLDGDATPPVVSMLRPQLGAKVRGSAVTVSATASDNLAVAGVQFTIDGNNLGPEVTAAPYTYTWNTTTATNGPHLIGARARDTAGHKTTALAGTVTVNN